MKTPPLKTMIVGCGMMAGGYDLDANGAPKPGGGWATHAAVCHAHNDFELTCFIDVKKEQRELFSKAWPVSSTFATVQAALAEGIDFDIAIISSPTASHADVLETLLQSSVRAVLCEKPLTEVLEHAQKMVAAYEDHNIPLAVNFTRRWNPDVRALKHAIADDAWGRAIGFTGSYTGGFLHNGSHMMDLLLFLLGGISNHQALNFQLRGAHDGDIDVWLEMENGATGLVASRDRAAISAFELEMWFEQGVITLKDWGRVIETRRGTPSPFIPDRLELGGAQLIKTKWKHSLQTVLENVRDAVRDGALLECSGKAALVTQTVCENIFTQAFNSIGRST